MEPIFIYFKEIAFNENNKFTLKFSQTDQIYKVHFSPKKDYFFTSINCDINLEQDIKNDGVLDEIKELSEKSWPLLEKGPAYQNDIKTMYLWRGVLEQHLEKHALVFCCPQQLKIVLVGTANFTTLKKKK